MADDVARHAIVHEPPLARWLLADTRSAGIWLVLRVWLGWKWIDAALHKVGNPAWTGPQAGAAVSGFLRGALERAGGDRPDVPGWYAAFIEHVALPNARLFSFLVAYGELLVGIALVLGALTGIAAVMGSLLNINFMLAGALSSNPIMFVVATWIVLAWRVAGWYGLDRWLLPALGTPWEPGAVFRRTRW